MSHRTTDQTTIAFPLVAGDRAEFVSSSDAFRDLDGACRIERPLEPTECDADEAGTMFRVTCLNGSARNGSSFDAYASELSR